MLKLHSLNHINYTLFNNLLQVIAISPTERGAKLSNSTKHQFTSMFDFLPVFGYIFRSYISDLNSTISYIRLYFISFL